MQDNVSCISCCIVMQQLNVVGDSCESTFVLKRKADILSISYDILTFQFISDTVIFLLTYVKHRLLITSRWIMVWNKAVFCLEVLIYKRLQQIWRYHDVISRNESLISTFQNLPILRYNRYNFCLNWHISHENMTENVSGCFFSEHSVEEGLLQEQSERSTVGQM